MSRHLIARFSLLSSLILPACGGDDGGPGNGGPSNPTMAKASPSGDGQTGVVGAQLPDPLRVRITQGGNAVAGTAVTWAVTAGGGTVNPSTTTTGADGTASTILTLTAAGNVSVTATAAGVVGSPQTFTATATGAGLQATVQVVNNDFNPSTAAVRATGTVTFTWATGSTLHNVTPVAPATIPASPGLPQLLSAPFSFDVTFPTQGTFVYFCSSHGTAQGGMRGTITVVP